MTEPLFTVERTFRIPGRGLVLVGITADLYTSVRVGDRLEIRLPDGSVLRAAVCGVEYPPSIKWIGERPAEARYGLLVDVDDVPEKSVVMAERRPA